MMIKRAIMFALIVCMQPSIAMQPHKKQSHIQKSALWGIGAVSCGLITYGLYKHPAPFMHQAHTIINQQQDSIINNFRYAYLGLFGSLTGYLLANSVEDTLPMGRHFSNTLKYAAYAHGMVLATGYTLTRSNPYSLLGLIGATSGYGLYQSTTGLHQTTDTRSKRT